MDFNEYQRLAQQTAEYPEKYKVIYPAIALPEEVGELLGKIAKNLRGDADTGLSRESIKKEAGDVLWQFNQLLTDLGISLDEVAELNIAKLRDRANRGVIKGSGDSR